MSQNKTITVQRNEVNTNDVLGGRGGKINSHPGNSQFRDLVRKYKDEYDKAKKMEKVFVAERVVNAVRSMKPPGRFLKEQGDHWVEIGDELAKKKTGQALRDISVHSTTKEVNNGDKKEEDTEENEFKSASSFTTATVSSPPPSLSFVEPKEHSDHESGQTFDQFDLVDSWDQGASGESQSRNLEDESPKRLLFRGMKKESACLPPPGYLFSGFRRHSSKTGLLRESLLTQVTQEGTVGNEYEQATAKMMESCDMHDSLDELIVDTLLSGRSVDLGRSISENRSDRFKNVPDTERNSCTTFSTNNQTEYITDNSIMHTANNNWLSERTDEDSSDQRCMDHSMRSILSELSILDDDNKKLSR